MPAKSSRWYGSSLASAALRSSSVLGEDHLAHRVDAVALEEHVLGAAQADAAAPNATALAACSGVSALVRTLMRVASAHHFISCWKLLYFSVFFAVIVAVDQAGKISDGSVLTCPA